MQSLKNVKWPFSEQNFSSFRFRKRNKSELFLLTTPDCLALFGSFYDLTTKYLTYICAIKIVLTYFNVVYQKLSYWTQK